MIFSSSVPASFRAAHTYLLSIACRTTAANAHAFFAHALTQELVDKAPQRAGSASPVPSGARDRGCPTCCSSWQLAKRRADFSRPYGRIYGLGSESPPLMMLAPGFERNPRLLKSAWRAPQGPAPRGVLVVCYHLAEPVVRTASSL